MLQPRLAMTAAMAFFSIALTLNLTGVRLSELRPSDLKPSSIRRGFYEANAHVVRYYDNLRVVYELESRVRDLQHGSDNDGPVNNTPATNPSAKPEDQQDQQQPNNQKSAPKQNRPRPSSGSSRREAPGGNHILSVGYSQRRHIPAVTEALFISQPRFSRNMLEGGLV
jgi:hypothetical protein